MTTQITKNLLRRTAVALAAVTTFMFAGDVAAQSVTLSGATGNTCNYSSMSVLPNGSVSVSCLPPSGGTDPGTFTLTLASSVIVGNQITATVNRSGGVTGAVSINYSVSGAGCSPLSGSFTFPDNDSTGRTFQVTGQSAGSCIAAISSPSSGTLGTPNQVTVTVNAAGGGGPIDPNCPAIPDGAIESNLIQGGKNLLGLTSGQVAFLAIPPTNPGHNSGAIKLGETTNSPDPVTIEMAISKCKGQFGPIGTGTGQIRSGCYIRSTQRNFNRLEWIGKPIGSVTPDVADMMGWCHALEDGTTRYVNVRYTFPACQYPVCSFAITWTDGSL